METPVITILDSDLASIARDLEMWPFVRSMRLFDLDYAMAVSAAIEGREGELEGWYEIAAWTHDVAIGYWLLSQEHENAAYVDSILVKLEAAHFEAGGGLRGTIQRGETPDAEDYEGALEVLARIREFQADR
jgi:hypothetical protein